MSAEYWFNNRSDADKVQIAYYFAQAAHAGQTRKYTNEPYAIHCLAVFHLINNYTQAPMSVRVAGILHDVLEDTKVTKTLLYNLFGDEITNMVVQVTDVSKPEDGNRKTRKRLDLEHLARGGYGAHTIKLADLIDNTGSIVQHDPEFAKVYLAEKRELLDVLTAGDAALMRIARETLESAEKQLAGRV